jgi:hypothetical protein
MNGWVCGGPSSSHGFMQSGDRSVVVLAIVAEAATIRFLAALLVIVRSDGDMSRAVCGPDHAADQTLGPRAVRSTEFGALLNHGAQTT